MPTCEKKRHTPTFREFLGFPKEWISEIPGTSKSGNFDFQGFQARQRNGPEIKARI
jgi:hypothetical protein